MADSNNGDENKTVYEMNGGETVYEMNPLHMFQTALEAKRIPKAVATSPDLKEAVEANAEGDDSVYELLGLIIVDVRC